MAPVARDQWTTEDVEPRHALAYWVDAVCRSFLEIDIDSPDRSHFQARLEGAAFGAGSLYLVQARAQHVRRTPTHIARSRDAWTFLMQVREGKALYRQYGRECALLAGDCVVVDCTEPYELDCLGPTRSLVLRFPKQWLATWLPSVESAAARVFHPGAGWGGALTAALAGLNGNDEADLGLPVGTMADQLAGLVALAAGPHAPAARPAEQLYQRLHAALRARCLEHDLSPADFAASQGISRRYLHLLFARAGKTYGGELMQLRVEAARRMLADCRCNTMTIADIAARCGFVEPSHFARRFRLTFGLGPVEFRRRAGAQISTDQR